MNFGLFLPVIYSILSSLGLGALNIPLLIILVIIGLIIIVLIKLYFLTGDLLWTGIAFLVVALLSLIAKI
jgi:hypothetical protein